MLVYKVVESSVVTDEALERIINQWVAQGWAIRQYPICYAGGL